MNPYRRQKAQTAARPSGKAFSFRLTDDERAQLQAAVDLQNKGKGVASRGGYWGRETVGGFVKKAALGHAALLAATSRNGTAGAAVRAAARETGRKVGRR